MSVNFRTVHNASPTLVGQVFGVTVPGHEIWRVRAARFSIVAGATVATRNPRLEFVDGQGNLLAMENGTGIAASTTGVYTYIGGFGVTTGNGATPNSNTATLPDFLLPPGYGVQCRNVGGQAGDTCGFFDVWIEAVFNQADAPPPASVSLGSELADLEHALETGRMAGLG